MGSDQDVHIIYKLSQICIITCRKRSSQELHGAPYAPLHRDFLKIQMKQDAEAVELALKWFEENMPFDNNRDKELLMSFSTGLTSTGGDSQC